MKRKVELGSSGEYDKVTSVGRGDSNGHSAASFRRSATLYVNA